jgi:hypothetical protein
MTKQQMKQSADQHIASTKGVQKNKVKGFRESAWAECLAFEKIMQKNREEK